MSNTYSQVHIHLIFAVKYRAALIQKEWKEGLHRYITGVFQTNRHKMLQINSVPDHIHILIGLHPAQSVSSIVQNVKTESSKWVKTRLPHLRGFAWQEGFGAFSHSKGEVDNIVRYIQNQETHHKQETFLEEYHRFLKDFSIEYQERYSFKSPS